MSKNINYGKSSDTLGAGHKPLTKEGGQVRNIVSHPLTVTSKHSRGSLSTYQKPKKKSRQLAKAKRRQNRGR